MLRCPPMWAQYQIAVDSRGRGSYDITDQINARVRESGIALGVAHLFVKHTSASLIVCENADPSVRSDLETYMARAVPDGDPMFEHTAEGSDDMPAHVRTVLTHTSVTIPISSRGLDLGVWQGIYLWEHRHHPHRRTVTLTLNGEKT